ncbi:MAG: xylulokinase, partial [Anaerolineae bacterium]
ESGAVRGVAAPEYPFETPRPLWSEQQPDLWWQATITGIRQVLDQSQVDPASIAGVGLTGQMHGLVLLDAAGNVLRPAILWNDQRTGDQCHTIRQRVGRERLIQITGNDALPGFTAPKILWVQEHEPEIYAQVAHLLLPKDYVRYRLTGEYATDKAGAAGTLLVDIEARDWSVDLLTTLDIPPQWLPPCHEGPHVTGYISARAAEATGLKAGIPVVGGGGDQAAQAVGVGAVEPGIVALTLGTSGVVFASTGKPFVEPGGRLHAFCHALPGRWHLMGVMLSAAGSLRWYRDTLAPGIPFDALIGPAHDVPAGSEGLLFLPYLTGERTPYADPLARGAFVGLTVRHSQAHMTRSLLEGVGLGLRDIFELIQSAGLDKIRQVRISGGGAKSALWRQILADILGTELVTVNTTEGAAYGAALLAATGAGVYADVDSACAATIHVVGSTSPGPDAAVYEEIYPLYRDLYPALRSTFAAVASVT